MSVDGTPHETTASAEDVRELLGLLAYTQLTASLRYAHDAGATDVLSRRLAFAELAAREHGRLTVLREHIDQTGGDSLNLLRRYHGVFDEYESRTHADSWHERILKGYIGHSVALDFCRIAVSAAPGVTRDLVTTLLVDDRAQDLARDVLEAKITDDHTFASRLALWGRRVVGEALGQVQQVVSREPALARLLSGGAAGSGFTPDSTAPTDEDKQLMAWLYAQLTAEHSRRMDRLGLAA